MCHGWKYKSGADGPSRRRAVGSVAASFRRAAVCKTAIQSQQQSVDRFSHRTAAARRQRREKNRSSVLLIINMQQHPMERFAPWVAIGACISAASASSSRRWGWPGGRASRRVGGWLAGWVGGWVGRWGGSRARQHTHTHKHTQPLWCAAGAPRRLDLKIQRRNAPCFTLALWPLCSS